MKAIDVRCPICGTLNRRLFFEETDGTFECESCNEVINTTIVNGERVPIVTPQKLVRAAK